MKQSFRFLLFAFLILPAFFLPAAARSASQTPPDPVLVDHAGGAYNGIEVTLTADKAPHPGEIVTLTLEARPLHDAPDVTVMWELTDGGELMNDALSASLGSLAAGESAVSSRQVRFESAGVFSVRAKASYFPNDATSLAATGVLFFTVQDSSPSASDLDPRTPVYQAPLPRSTVDKSKLLGNSLNGVTGDPCFNVKGSLARENRMPVAVVVPEGPPPPAVPRYSGQYQDQLGSAVPVHNMLVELREEDVFSDDSYGYTVTSATGQFNFSFCDDDGVFDDELELYFRVCAEVWEGPNRIARIEDIDSRDLYCWDSGVIQSDGGTVDFDLSVYKLNQLESSVFNIGDAIYYGWRFWNNNNAASPFFDRSVTALWQAGKGQKGSYYSRSTTSLVIADDPSSTDEWDDSVIIHEWTHFADHQFGCYQNPGGSHSLPGTNAGVNGTRLAWGEGYPDYYQSAARTIMPGTASVSFYVDPDGPTVDLENMRGVTASDRDEGAVSALLWDFLDTANDNSDTVTHGQAAIQQIYTSPDFQGNPQCDMRRFLQVWRKLGQPTDAATAATIVQNANITLASLPVLSLVQTANTTSQADGSPAAVTAAAPFDFRWWDQTTMVVDTSSSMAGPPATPKINTVKTIIGEQVNDLAPKPAGTEFNIYTFDAGSPAVKPLVEGKFFANQVLPPVNNLTAVGPDAGCPVPGLGALKQAADSKFDGEAWLYTDGDSADSVGTEQMRLFLNERRLRGSIALLGGCGSPAKKQPDVSGSEETYLNLAADGSQPSGIVPYMLTALGTGGQFIYVAPDQLANAVDIVRAQLSHTAGAGRWSDYVSANYTYRWDRLEPWEYQWFPAESLGQDAGQMSEAVPVRINLPNPFPFFGKQTSTVDVDEDGFILMNPCLNPPFCASLDFQSLNLLYKDLWWKVIAPGPSGPEEVNETGMQAHVYTANFAFEWVIISLQGIANYNPPGALGDFAPRRFQAWLNYKTGEIRYQYDVLRNEAATAEISLINSDLFQGGNVVASLNDFSGASSGMGYKFTPAPPQPAKVFDVEVDPLISSVIFLQTGYSGTFAPLAVTYPDGSAVDCNDTANVRCLTMDSQPGDRMVQFVQVNTAGLGGVFKATVAMGSSGGGTFSFNAMAASDLRASSPDKHTLGFSAHILHLDLGRPSDNGQLEAWLQMPNGAAFGSPFTMFDDGQHEDDAAGDGRFGSDPFMPPTYGAAYLWVKGSTQGIDFKRSDPVPFNFQPLEVWAVPTYQEGIYDNNIPVVFYVTNQGSVQHCYAAEFSVPDGWEYTTPYSTFCIEAGSTLGPYLFVSRSQTEKTLGEVGEVGMTLTEVQEGSITGSAVAQVALFRKPAALEFDNRQTVPLRPNGTDTAELTLNLVDDLGQIVGYSGAFNGELGANGGTVSAPTGLYEDGRLPVLFTAGTTAGTATISVIAEGGLTAETTIQLAEPVATFIELTATPNDLRTTDEAKLTVKVLNNNGSPAPGAKVRLSVSDDDGSKGTIGGGEVFIGTTGTQGRLETKFLKANGATGTVMVRAELLAPGGAVKQEVSVMLYFSEAAPDLRVYLPLVIGSSFTGMD